jgi:hypothetical protein
MTIAARVRRGLALAITGAAQVAAAARARARLAFVVSGSGSFTKALRLVFGSWRKSGPGSSIQRRNGPGSSL